jgi:hypothetical protein
MPQLLFITASLVPITNICSVDSQLDQDAKLTIYRLVSRLFCAEIHIANLVVSQTAGLSENHF